VDITGWLDGHTAARLRRPALLLVSTDLPDGAVNSVVTGFRYAAELQELPVVVAGDGASRLDGEVLGPRRADHYLPAPIGGPALAAAVKEVIRKGRVPWRERPGARAVLALTIVGMFAMFAAITAEPVLRLVARKQVPPAVAWLLFGVTLTAYLAAAAVAIVKRERPLAVPQWRTVLAYAGFIAMNGGRLAPGAGRVAQSVGITLGFGALAAWAWLGPLAKPRSRGAALGFRILAGVLLLIGLIPWAVIS
jgi:hypothetical protein